MSDVSSWDVIIVDDEPDNIGVIELVMEFHSATVRTAVTGQRCLALLEERLPTVILVDIQMPDMSGFELLEKIHQDKRCRNLPVIAVTAHAMAGDEERILAAGFNGYIAKPINTMTFIDDLKAIVDARKPND